MKGIGGALLLWWVLALSARAAPGPAPNVRGIEVHERVGVSLPTHLRFMSAQGEPVRLDDLRGRGLPVLLVLAYARCNMLCNWVLQGVSQALPQLEDMIPGRDYLPVVVSIDPRESPGEAATKQASLLARLRLTGGPRDLPFLVGSEDQVQALAASLGFVYAWDPRSEQYAHPAVVFVLTPQLRVSRYLYGVQYPAQRLREALLDARQGRVVSTEDSSAEADALLRCFRFITGSHRYAEQLQSYFRLGGITILMGLAALIASLVLWERRRGR